MAGGEHEPVAARPFGIVWVHIHDPLKQGVGQWCQRHGGAGVARAAFLDGFGGQDAGGVYRPSVGVRPVGGIVTGGGCLKLRG